MSNAIHNGDTAEYHGKVKALRGCRCLVHTTTSQRVLIIVRAPGDKFLKRHVKPGNLKRLGGGVIDES